MATPLNTIKNWFKTGLKPTQAQFWATWDSFWHKSENIPQTAIDGLQDSFDKKADAEGLALVATSGSYNDLLDKPESLWLGTFTSMENLELAHPAPREGSKANIDAGVGGNVKQALWDNNDSKWILGGDVVGSESEINGAPIKPTIVDADEVAGLDSEDGSTLTRWSFLTIKNAIKQHLNTIYVSLTGDQNVEGTKTFSNSPIVPDPTTDMQAANRKFVLANAGSGGTTYATGTQGQLDTGTDGSVKVWSPSVLAAWLSGKGFKTTDTTYAVVSNTVDGLAPKTGTPTGGRFLADDKTWKEIIGGATYGVFSPTTDGLVPKSGAGSATKVLHGDGAWKTPEAGGAVDSVNGRTGAVVLKEEDIIGNSENVVNIVGSVNIDFKAKAHRNWNFNGANPNITFTNLPPNSSSLTRTFKTQNIGGTRSLSVTNTNDKYGDFNPVPSAKNFITIHANTNSTGVTTLDIFFSNPT